MFTHCLICSTVFEPNDELAHLPLGRRVAFDPDRGRLWVVCRRCGRWSLVPMDARWEALEELERLAVDRARLLTRTDHIALMRAGPLELVRVGASAGRREEAWWRYGEELVIRRERHRVLASAGAMGFGAVAVGGWMTGGVGFVGAWLLWTNQEWASRRVTEAARWLRFGSAAWRGWRECPSCGFGFRALPFRERRNVELLSAEDGVELRLDCPRCRQGGEAGLVLTGRPAERAFHRILAYQNHAGARKAQVGAATKLIEDAGDPTLLQRQLVGRGSRLSAVRRTGLLALEIAAAEERERSLLELRAAELEAHWREEEELAAIIDGELTPVPLIEDFRRRVLGVSGRGA